MKNIALNIYSFAFGKNTKKITNFDDPMDIDVDEKIVKSSIEFNRISTLIFNVDFLSKLPYELAQIILLYVPASSLPNVALTCQQGYQLVKDNRLWEKKFKENEHWKLRIQPEQRFNLDWNYLYRNRFLLYKNWLNNKNTVSTIKGHIDSVYCIQFKDNLLVSGSRDQTIKFWNLSDKKCVRVMSGHTGSVLCFKFDSEILVSGSSDMTVVVWDMKTGQILHRLAHHTAGVLDVAIDDEFIISCSKDNTIKVYERKSGKLLYSLNAHRAAVNALILKNKRIVTGSGDYSIKIWDVYTGQLLRELRGHSRGIACVQFDGKTIISGSNDQHIKVWNANTGELIVSLKQHKELVRTLDFNDDFIISGSYDQTIIVWSRKTYKPIRIIEDAHESWVFNLVIGQSKFISASQDTSIKIWNFEEGVDVKYFEN